MIDDALQTGAGPSYEDRKGLFAQLEAHREGRTLVTLMNFDRGSDFAGLVESQFDPEVKEALFRVLKDSWESGTKGVDVFLYTRGGDTNAVWPLVSLIREFDKNFEVLIPFRCHSAGTLFALGARRIVLGPLSELSPIDPSTGNQFNPIDPLSPQQRMPISVEDVKAFQNFVRSKLGKESNVDQAATQAVDHLVSQVHPLALGNVHRVHKQIKKLARSLLGFHEARGFGVPKAVQSLTTNFYSHTHMINRTEAREILGEDRVIFAPDALAKSMDVLLRGYEDRFALRRPFLMNVFMKGELRKDARLIRGVVESSKASYFQELRAVVTQFSKIPANVQVQVPFGQPMPLVPGLPTNYDIQVVGQGWLRNKQPQGFET